MNHTIVRCYLNITEVQAITFGFEKEEEDLVRSHWENFQHPKPTVLYKQLAENMREEIRANFARTQTVKYEHDVVKESLHNETVRVKTVDEKRAENRRKMDLLFARHKARVTGLHLESARVLDSLEDQRRETSDHLADLKEDHLATVAALNQNARDVDEHLRAKTEEHRDSMSNYYQRWHDNHEDAEETIINLRRSNSRVGEGMEDAGEFYFGNPEPVLNITELGNTTNASAVSNAAEDDGDRRRRMLQADGDIVGSTKEYDIIREHVDDDDDLWISDTGESLRRRALEPLKGCVAWRQTRDCDGDAAREPQADDSCQALIDPGRSGYCECDAEAIYRTNCGHAAFTCGAACNSDQPISREMDALRVASRKATRKVRDAKAKAEGKRAVKVAELEAAVADAAADEQESTAKEAAVAEAEAAASEAARAKIPAAAPVRAPVEGKLAGVSDPTNPGWRPRLGSGSARSAMLETLPPQKVAAAASVEEGAAELATDSKMKAAPKTAKTAKLTAVLVGAGVDNGEPAAEVDAGRMRTTLQDRLLQAKLESANSAQQELQQVAGEQAGVPAEGDGSAKVPPPEGGASTPGLKRLMGALYSMAKRPRRKSQKLPRSLGSVSLQIKKCAMCSPIKFSVDILVVCRHSISGPCSAQP
jgi:hypothetical protein